MEIRKQIIVICSLEKFDTFIVEDVISANIYTKHKLTNENEALPIYSFGYCSVLSFIAVAPEFVSEET